MTTVENTSSKVPSTSLPFSSSSLLPTSIETTTQGSTKTTTQVTPTFESTTTIGYISTTISLTSLSSWTTTHTSSEPKTTEMPNTITTLLTSFSTTIEPQTTTPVCGADMVFGRLSSIIDISPESIYSIDENGNKLVIGCSVLNSSPGWSPDSTFKSIYIDLDDSSMVNDNQITNYFQSLPFLRV